MKWHHNISNNIDLYHNNYYHSQFRKVEYFVVNKSESGPQRATRILAVHLA